MKKLIVVACIVCKRKDGSGEFYLLKLKDITDQEADAFGQTAFRGFYYYAVPQPAAKDYVAELDIENRYRITKKEVQLKDKVTNQPITVHCNYLTYLG